MNDSVKKIRFALDDGVVEIMHVRLLPDVSLVLDNIPFYAYGVSCGDTIATERDEDGLMFVGVLARGGGIPHIESGCQHSQEMSAS